MSTATSPAIGDRLILDNVDWNTYSRLLRAFADRPGLRLTYDGGVLEIMSPLRDHELAAYMIGRFIDTLTDELEMDVEAGRSTTLRRRARKKGLEPDNCYWIANHAKVRGKRQVDLRVDPPPDLAIEVDVTNSSLDRMGIYAALGVPEVWRLADSGLSFHLLGAKGRYREATHSLSFPCVTAADLMRYLDLLATLGNRAVVRQFRAWVQQQRDGV